ncbi:MAG: DUF364 domain-containing protein [Gammaproteobacteria bacterium]|nr:DUF364 domain-containing protein [Gammaproteobacteria bacterium]
MQTRDPGQSAILGELLSEVRSRLGAGAEALTVERAVLGIFFTGVKLANGAGGLCATPIKSLPEAVCCPSSARATPAPGRISGRKALEVLEDLQRPQDLRRALAIATLNALTETLWLRDGPPAGVEASDGDAFAALRIAPGQRVALVGAFPPYMRELRRRNQPFNVLELDPKTLKPDELPHYVPAERAADVLPDADVFITTGTTLLNGTLEDLLRLLRPGVEAAVIGPTATLMPEPYFRRGVTVIGGTRVVDADGVLELLAEGGSGYHLFGKTVARVTLRAHGRAAG